MACREKKIFAGRKQASVSPVPPKETVATLEVSAKQGTPTSDVPPTSDDEAAPKLVPMKATALKVKTAAAKAATALAKKITKNVAKKAMKKSLAVNLKAKNKKTLKIKKQYAKALLTTGKNNFDIKKSALLKNGVKPKRNRKTKAQMQAERLLKEQLDDEPPVLEPILPLEDILEKKGVKKRMKKAVLIDEAVKNIKTENSLMLIDETINSVVFKNTLDEGPKPARKRGRKSKQEVTETIEDVIKDLSNLIEGQDIKQEPILSEVEKTETIKRRGYTRKPKSELLKRKTIKKELIENNLEDNITIDASAQHLIDVLDLSVVQKISQLASPMCNRRHSIEKFPVSVFSSLPRTPRAKRVGRPRQSLDVSFGKRINPYSTRSDSQALRNGKHRKAKEALFDGLDNVSRKRKTLCSDFSGSEKSISKLGYESDCSFSDQVSSCGPDSLDQKDGPIKPDMIKTEIIEPQNQTDTQDIVNIKSSSNSKALNIKKRVPSVESLSNNVEDDVKSEQNYTDNNSNLYDNSESFSPIKMEVDDFSDVVVGNPSSKVPEKSIILDIMKQTFNDTTLEEQEKRSTRSATFKKPNHDESASQSSTVSTSQFYGTGEESGESEEVSKSLEISATEETENGANIDEVQAASDNHEDESGMCVNGDVRSPAKIEVEETPENFAIKKDIMQALGLLTLEAAEEAKKNQILAAQEAKMRKEDRKDKASTSDEGKKDKVFKSDYTGTLKTVIKLNRGDKRKGRNSLKLTLTKTKPKSTKENNDIDCGGTQDDHSSKYAKEVLATSWRTHAQVQSSDTAGALRKSHYSNRSNIMDGSSEDGDPVVGEGEDPVGKSLVIPEKASSFSIHPGRVCKDECSNCNTKFGIFDTPQHIAQLKGVDRQNNILQNELKLTRDSCLCDACYRHVDRKANTPSYSSKGSKRNNLITPRQNYCHVLGCNKQASNILRRKVIIKMRKSICHTVNIDLDNPGLHSIPLCDDHYSLVEILMVCSMCKRRLAANHIHYMGPETTVLNQVLNEMNIPVSLNDSLAVCKCCKLFATLALKSPEEKSKNDSLFFDQYKRRLLHFHKIELMNDAEAEEPISVPNKEAKEKFEKEQIIKKRKKFNQKLIENSDSLSGAEPQSDLSEKNDQTRVPSDSNSTSKSRSESPSDYMVDYNMLTPSIAMECGSDAEANKRDIVKPLKRAKSESVIKDGVEISKSVKISKIGGFNKTVQRLGTNPCLSVRQLFPGEEELGLQASIEYGNVKEKTPEGWEKCTSTIQYDADTKHLWNELQKPYGNQSSFLRHLILLEKYFRNGDLVLSPNASHHSINYSESVHNRLRAYDNIPTAPQPITLTVKKSNSGIITTKDAQPNVPTINAANIPKNTPITISQINHIASNSKTRNPGVPPGLISIHPGPSRPSTSSNRAASQQSQKIKFPITKNWKPNLIPIDPSKKDDKRPGYVRVVSNEKPYHITLDDYNRMCAIKKSYDLKRKRMMDAALAASQPVNQSSAILKTLGPRKGLTISTKTATITSPPSDNSYSESMDTESSLEKLDRTVENLESKFKESTTTLMNLPKIPKSLTVIPQTVAHKPTRPSSPNLMILPKPKSLTNKS